MGFLSILRSIFAAIGAVGILIFFITVAEQFSSGIFLGGEVVYEAPAPVVVEVEDIPALPEIEPELEKEATVVPADSVSPAPSEPTTHATPDPVRSVASNGASEWQVARVLNPYGIPPRPFDEINARTRAALVNIFCNAKGALAPITASGVVISASGVILTNAHVAQYLLIEHSGKVNLNCTVRTGSPARDTYLARVLYITPEWVREHAHELKQSQTLGTGEHDWALLYITKSTNGAPLPAVFPHVPPDVRSAIGFTGDAVLAASYPAGFLGGTATSRDLYAASAPTTIQELMTFSSGSADLFSIGGTITAQSGSSGGAVVNMWGYLVGLITTMKEGETTAERDLRALSLNYVNADLKAHTGLDLVTTTNSILPNLSNAFMEAAGNALAELLLEQLKN